MSCLLASFCLHPPSSVVWKNSLQTEANLYQDVEVRDRETALAILVELLDIAIPEAGKPTVFPANKFPGYLS